MENHTPLNIHVIDASIPPELMRLAGGDPSGVGGNPAASIPEPPPLSFVQSVGSSSLEVLLPELISAALTNSLQPIQANIEKKFAFIEGKISQMESNAAEKSITGQEGQGGSSDPNGKRPAPRLKSVVCKPTVRPQPDDGQSQEESDESSNEEESDGDEGVEDDQISVSAPDGDEFPDHEENDWSNLIVTKKVPSGPVLSDSIWASTEEYMVERVSGPKVQVSELVEKAKTMFSTQLPAKSLADKLKTTKVPENCTFLVNKRVNKEIWALASPEVRSCDVKLQSVYDRVARSETEILRASDRLISVANKRDDNGERVMPSQEDLMAILGHLREATVFNGCAAMEINNLRRASMKKFINPQMHSLTSEVAAEPDGDLLFGTDLEKRIVEIRGQNKAQEALTKTTLAPKGGVGNQTKRKKPEADAGKPSQTQSDEKAKPKAKSKSKKKWRKKKGSKNSTASSNTNQDEN